MNINSAFPRAYLKASDLQGRRVTVTIARVLVEEIGGENKPVLKFVGKDRGIVLNKTNAAMIAEIANSEETDDWKGVAIAIYPTKTDYQGKRVDCIRVEYPAGAPVKPAAVAPVHEDEVPF